MWQVSASLGRMRGASSEFVEHALVVFCQTNLPQPPTIAVVTERRQFTTAGMTGLSFSATLDPKLAPFWPEPGFIVDILIVDAGSGPARSADLSHDSRWLATIHRVDDSRGEAATSAIWNSLVIEP